MPIIKRVKFHWLQIKRGGWLAFRRKFVKVLLYGTNVAWAIPVVLIVRIISPWLLIRFGVFTSFRSGHFIMEPTLYLARESLRGKSGKRTKDIFWFPRPTCNDQWAKMICRKLYVRWWVRYLMGVNRFIPGGQAHEVDTTSTLTDFDGVLQRTSERFELTAEEDEKAKRWLKCRGWKEGEPFVCFLVRDSAYLAKAPGLAGSTTDFSYHDYRDSHIETYLPAMEWLISEGYWVIRMGKIMHKRVPFTHMRLVDYPFVEDQDDLIDVWLSMHCAFFVTSGSGIDMFCPTYNRPAVLVNFLPLTMTWVFANVTVVPKHLYWISDGTQLTLKEYLCHGYVRSEEYEKSKIGIKDLSSAEILDVVMECEKRFVSRSMQADEQSELQKAFWDEFRRYPNFNQEHGYIHPKARVGTDWLSSRNEMFLSRVPSAIEGLS